MIAKGASRERFANADDARVSHLPPPIRLTNGRLRPIRRQLVILYPQQSVRFPVERARSLVPPCRVTEDLGWAGGAGSVENYEGRIDAEVFGGAGDLVCRTLHDGFRLCARTIVSGQSAGERSSAYSSARSLVLSAA